MFQVLPAGCCLVTVLSVQRRIWLILLCSSPQPSGIYKQWYNDQLITPCDLKFFLESVSSPFSDYRLASSILDKFIPICKCTLIIQLVSSCRLNCSSGLPALCLHDKLSYMNLNCFCVWDLLKWFEQRTIANLLLLLLWSLCSYAV